MTRVIVTFRLLGPEHREPFEAFMRDTDGPAARALATVISWDLFTIDPREGAPDYVVIADVTGEEAWRREAAPGMALMGPALAELAVTTSTFVCEHLL